MKKELIVILLLTLSSTISVADEALKKAFSEGLKTSIEVVEYEALQMHNSIEAGFCAAITGKVEHLKLWEEVKLESLALYFGYSPALFESTDVSGHTKRVLCLSVEKQKENVVEALEQMRTMYPKLNNYLTSVEALPTHGLYRMIPGIDRNLLSYPASAIENKSLVMKKKIPEELVIFKTDNVEIVKTELPNVLLVKQISVEGSK